MNFKQYISDKQLNESQDILDFIEDAYPFYSCQLIPKTFKLAKYCLSDEGEEVVNGDKQVTDFSDDTILLSMYNLQVNLLH